MSTWKNINKPPNDQKELQFYREWFNSVYRNMPREGTWTPILTASTTPPVLTYANVGGTYTRQGRKVDVTGRLDVATITSVGVGQLLIGGLPFPTTADTGDRGGGIVTFGSGWVANSTPRWIIGAGILGSNSLNLYKNASADARDANTGSLVGDMAVGCVLLFCATYYTNDPIK